MARSASSLSPGMSTHTSRLQSICVTSNSALMGDMLLPKEVNQKPRDEAEGEGVAVGHGSNGPSSSGDCGSQSGSVSAQLGTWWLNMDHSINRNWPGDSVQRHYHFTSHKLHPPVSDESLDRLASLVQSPARCAHDLLGGEP